MDDRDQSQVGFMPRLGMQLLGGALPLIAYVIFVPHIAWSEMGLCSQAREAEPIPLGQPWDLGPQDKLTWADPGP